MGGHGCHRCGAPVAARTRHRRACGSCRPLDRRDAQIRYRERQKAREAPRPFLREQHGMTEDDYQAMLLAQGGACAGCGRTAPVAGKDLHIDHDHGCCPKGGRSCESCRRGLLCAECNMALGLLHDDQDTLRAPLAYLGGR